jgi:biopolymer transport protein ExbD
MKLRTATRKTSTDWVLQFINIVFLLLLYFLITGSISGNPGAGLLLPAAETVNGAPPGAAVAIDERGVIRIAGRTVAADRLAGALRPTPRHALLTVAADRRLRASALISTLKTLHGLGFTRLSVMSARNPP